MAYVVLALGSTFAALCVWLVVRIVNRRERWAKCTLAGVVAVPALYVASFGPACWLARPLPLPKTTPAIVLWSFSEYKSPPDFYWPLCWSASRCGNPFYHALKSYGRMCIRDTVGLAMPVSPGMFNLE